MNYIKLASCSLLHCYSHIKYCGVSSFIREKLDSYFGRNLTSDVVLVILPKFSLMFKKTMGL